MRYYIIYTSPIGPLSIEFHSEQHRKDWCAEQDPLLESYTAINCTGSISQTFVPIMGKQSCQPTA